MGWSSSSSPDFDFQANGSAIPMYALFVVCLIFFLVGVHRHLRALRAGTADASASVGATSSLPGNLKAGVRRLARLVELGFVQRRILSRRSSGFVHLSIFWGFVVLLLGSLTIMVDLYVLQPLGLVLSRELAYRLFQMSLDLFGVAFVLGVCIAIHRRIWIRPEHTPADGRVLLVLWVLLGIGVSGFVLEGLRMRLEGSAEPWAFAGAAVAAVIDLTPPSLDSGMVLYRVLWWGHVVAAFALLATIPYSPLRHLFTAPLNILVSSGQPSGGLATPFNLKELMQTGRFDVKAGAETIEDFSWRERLALSACADFGGCQDVCPAHATGTALSPMRLVASLREAVQADGNKGRDSQELLGGAVSEDAVWSCTLCGACTGSCPVVADPMRYIVQLRRGLVARSRLGKERTAVLSNLSYARNPYGSNSAAREGLATALGLPAMGEQPDIDMLYWIGCAATFDSRAQAIAAATVKILSKAGIRCGVLGPEESCCGDPARRIGEEGLFQDLAFKNIETLERYGVKTVLTHCAHCFNTFRNEYPELGARFDVVHHATLIHDLIEAGAIEPAQGTSEPTTLHDACYIGRFDRCVEPPRAVLRSIPGTVLKEMPRSGKETFCCGAGGASYWYDVPRREKISVGRVCEAKATGAEVLVTECPFCLKMLEDALGPEGDGVTMRVRDIAEVVADSLEQARAT